MDLEDAELLVRHSLLQSSTLVAWLLGSINCIVSVTFVQKPKKCTPLTWLFGAVSV